MPTRVIKQLTVLGVLIVAVQWVATPGWAFTEAGSNNYFGSNAGGPAGTNNSFFGGSAGDVNTASNNSFFGFLAGSLNASGPLNSFYGESAGLNNTTGGANAFFGSRAGRDNISGINNSFIGTAAGINNTVGSFNSFLGFGAGSNNSSGANNTFVGDQTGLSNMTDSLNTLIGSGSDGAAGITNATAVGAKAKAAQSNSLILGSISGVNGATDTVEVGIGTTTPSDRLTLGGGGIQFENGTSPLLVHAESSATPAPRMVWSHSPAFPEWGVFYDDANTDDEMQFRQTAALPPILNVDFSEELVGLGTFEPTAQLHVASAGTKLLVEDLNGAPGVRTQFELVNSGGPRFFFSNSAPGGVQWQFSELSNNNFTISDVGDGGAEMILQPNGILRVGDSGVFDLVLDAVGNLTIAGTLTESSDRAKKTDITPADVSELLSAVRTLDISTWRYKGDDQLHLGPMAQDFHRLFGVGTSTTISPRDLAAVAVGAIQGQQAEINELERKVERLTALINR